MDIKKGVMTATLMILILGIALAAIFGYFSLGFRDWSFLKPSADETPADENLLTLTVIKSATPTYTPTATQNAVAVTSSDDDLWPKEIVIAATLRPVNMPNALSWEIGGYEGSAQGTWESGNRSEICDLIVAEDELSATVILKQPWDNNVELRVTAKSNPYISSYCKINYATRMTFSAYISKFGSGDFQFGVGGNMRAQIFKDQIGSIGYECPYYLNTVYIGIPQDVVSNVNALIASLGFTTAIRLKPVLEFVNSDKNFYYDFAAPDLTDFFEVSIPGDAAQRAAFASAYAQVKQYLLNALVESNLAAYCRVDVYAWASHYPGTEYDCVIYSVDSSVYDIKVAASEV